MKRRWGIAIVTAISALACGGHRFKYPAAATPLRLDRVVLYRNGVGYFERTGRIDGDILTLKVRKDQVNDLLKSLTVVERDSGHAVSVSMPLDPETWANAALATLRPGQGSLAQVLDSLRGSEVSLTTTDGEVHGRVAMVEQLVDAPDKPDGAPRIDHRVSLLDGDELRVVKLSAVRGLRLEDGDLAMQFNRTLDASAGEGMYQQVAVSIRLAGASSHDLLVSYVVAAPMWKPTYRVVVPAGGHGKALLQAWAVVDNTSGEEWRDVKLALTSGAPIAFRYDLHTPREVARPDLTDRGVQAQAEAYVGETTYAPPAEVATATPPPPPPAPMPSSGAQRPVAHRGPGGGGGGGYNKSANEESLGGDYGGVPSDQPAPSVDYDSLRRSTMAQARAATASGQTRFELDQRVTVPEGTSTMVAIVNADVEGEETFLYKPGGAGAGYEQNPYRVVRFQNSTPFVLEPGPIGIYSGGSFVGEGLSETVGAATSATVPFAVETGVMVTSTTGVDSDEMRLIKMSRGVLEVEQFARRTTTYTVKAQTLDDGFTVLLRHEKAGGTYELANRPAGTEDLPDGYLIPLEIAKGKREGTRKIVEQTPSRSQITIWDAPAIDLLERLVVNAQLGEDTKKKLRPIIDKRRAVAKLEEQIASITDQRNKLDQRAAELRRNLQAIAKNPQADEQRAKWTKQLDDFTTDGNKLGAQLAELTAKLLDQRTELENAVDELEITMPAGK
jgi:hypothetical protein